MDIQDKCNALAKQAINEFLDRICEELAEDGWCHRDIEFYDENWLENQSLSPEEIKESMEDSDFKSYTETNFQHQKKNFPDSSDGSILILAANQSLREITNEHFDSILGNLNVPDLLDLYQEPDDLSTEQRVEIEKVIDFVNLSRCRVCVKNELDQ